MLRDLSAWIMAFNLGVGRSRQVLCKEQTELDSQLAQREVKEDTPAVTKKRCIKLTQPGSSGAGHRVSALCSF